MGTPIIVPISDLRQDATNILKRVTTSREPIFITQRGRAAAVMVSMNSYEQTQQELEMLRLLARGQHPDEPAHPHPDTSLEGEEGACEK